MLMRQNLENAHFLSEFSFIEIWKILFWENNFKMFDNLCCYFSMRNIFVLKIQVCLNCHVLQKPVRQPCVECNVVDDDFDYSSDLGILSFGE